MKNHKKLLASLMASVAVLGFAPLAASADEPEYGGSFDSDISIGFRPNDTEEELPEYGGSFDSDVNIDFGHPDNPDKGDKGTGETPNTNNNTNNNNNGDNGNKNYTLPKTYAQNNTHSVSGWAALGSLAGLAGLVTLRRKNQK